MYNNYQPPGQYGRPPSNYGGAYPGAGPPPGIGAPGLGPPPSVAPAPGIQQPSSQQSPPPMAQNFQLPANMANFNTSARVIHLGKPDGPPAGAQQRRDNNSDQNMPNRRGAGLGFDSRDRDHNNSQQQHRFQNRDAGMAMQQPPSREEIARTIYIGNITPGCGGDEGIQKIIGVAGGLRRWTRASDADNKPCSFGFAEYEDADSLGTAIQVLKDVQVPTKKPIANGTAPDDDAATPLDKTTLRVIVDENSEKYMEEWRARGSMNDPEEAQFRVDSAKEELKRILATLENAADPSNPAAAAHTDQDGDTSMQETETKVDAVTGEVVTIPLATEDDLSDIPADMRETVAKEIAAFRDRSNRRDLERLRREEEMEQAEKARANTAARVNRLATPPPDHQAGSNGIPLGPRDRGVQGAPTGPKGFQGAQIPRDYQKGVSFVNGTSVNGTSGSGNFTREEEESDASDDEIERRRVEKKNAELEKLYLDQERRWLNRERNRLAALERERQRDKDEESNISKEKAAVADRLKKWDDDVEAERRVEEYYHDRSAWLRNRAAFRAREADQDDRDRAAEEHEKVRERERRNKEMGMADQFLAQQAEEIESRAQAQPQRFKMSLGAAAQKAQQSGPRRTMAEAEGLLEDEEDAEATTAKRTLVPLSADVTSQGAGLSEEERAEAARQLAKEIPSDKEGLWNWPIKWEFVDDAVVADQLRPFVERKIVEYLGVQEEMLVDVVEDAIRKKGSPQDLVGELEGALDEEAEVMVKKLWRMLIFFSESEKRGLSA